MNVLRIEDQRMLGPTGHLYVFGFSNGVVKVGVTSKPWQRRQSLKMSGRFLDATITAEWFSEELDGIKAIERDVIRFCERQGLTAHGREWFTGVSYEDVVAYCQSADWGGIIRDQAIARAAKGVISSRLAATRGTSLAVVARRMGTTYADANSILTTVRRPLPVSMQVYAAAELDCTPDDIWAEAEREVAA